MFPPDELLKEFLRKAHANTYAAGDTSRVSNPLRPGSTEYRFEDEKFRYIDIYFGSRTFIGQELVRYDNVPIWAMNYRGSLKSGVEKSVGFGFLRKALLAGVDAGEFLRGPKEWTDGSSLYTRNFHPDNNSWSDFDGFEDIYQLDANGQPTGSIYRGYFQGGAVRE